MKVDGPNMQPEVAKVLKELLVSGNWARAFCKQAIAARPTRKLTAKGVEFLSPPKEQFYGVEAIMKDNSGNC